jgi:multiple antibiotic resistance protein
MEAAASFIHLAFVGFVALFPPVNPLGSALLVDPLLPRLDASRRKAAARRVALYCLAICLGTALLGSWLFRAFGISLAVVQMAGGLVICQMGWQMLRVTPGVNEPAAAPAPAQSLEDQEHLLFYPVAFPMTAGPGTITVLLTLSARGHASELALYVVNIAALVFAVLLMCALIYLCYGYTPAVLKWLGARGQQIVSRLSAFLVFCVGLQIAAEGFAHLIRNIPS